MTILSFIRKLNQPADLLQLLQTKAAVNELFVNTDSLQHHVTAERERERDVYLPVMLSLPYSAVDASFSQ